MCLQVRVHGFSTDAGLVLLLSYPHDGGGSPSLGLLVVRDGEGVTWVSAPGRSLGSFSSARLAGISSALWTLGHSTRPEPGPGSGSAMADGLRQVFFFFLQQFLLRYSIQFIHLECTARSGGSRL